MDFVESIMAENKDLINSSELVAIKKEVPKRSYTGIVRRTNPSNKKLLRKDFSCRCCYCDDFDEIRSCKADYQVEHFAPFSRFKKLKNVYDNLLYSCRTCNGAKSNKWPSSSPKVSVVGNEGFLDPCKDEYYHHLARKKSGEIVYLTDLWKYMYENLNLFLSIHEICYILERYKEFLDQVDKKLLDESLNSKERDKIEKVKSLLNKEFMKYYSMKINQDS